MKRGTWIAAVAVALSAAMPARAQQALQTQVEARLAEAGAGTRWGLVVADDHGRELIAIAPDSRFVPASNTKIFTTAAAFATLGSLDGPDVDGGISVRLEGRDVILGGHGDARASSAPDCVSNCLAALADAVAAKTRRLRDVIGDATWFPDQRWSPGMSWNNIPTRSGTGIAALSLDDNELVVRVTPAAPGQPPALDSLAYYRVDNRALTVAEGETDLEFDRMPGSNLVRLTGTIRAGAETRTLRLGIDDPAHYAAWRFKALLESRGVRVSGAVRARHRPLEAEQFQPAAGPEPLARLVPPPLVEDLATINKASQNMHAELLIRRIGRRTGSGSIADGVAAMSAMLDRAGVPRSAYDFSDGSGMSTYNRVAPRGMVRLLRWIEAQPWGPAWRSTLPVGGIDGTLANRFKGGPLEGRIFAKTGTLNAANALAGYMIAASGRTLTFAIYAGDMPADASATQAMDAALGLIAQAN